MVSAISPKKRYRAGVQTIILVACNKTHTCGKNKYKQDKEFVVNAKNMVCYT